MARALAGKPVVLVQFGLWCLACSSALGFGAAEDDMALVQGSLAHRHRAQPAHKENQFAEAVTKEVEVLRRELAKLRDAAKKMHRDMARKQSAGLQQQETAEHSLGQAAHLSELSNSDRSQEAAALGERLKAITQEVKALFDQGSMATEEAAEAVRLFERSSLEQRTLASEDIEQDAVIVKTLDVPEGASGEATEAAEQPPHASEDWLEELMDKTLQPRLKRFIESGRLHERLSKYWTVVHPDGLPVRTSVFFGSTQLDGVLAAGAVVEELGTEYALDGAQWLHVKKRAGDGPPEGWVNVKAPGENEWLLRKAGPIDLVGLVEEHSEAQTVTEWLTSQGLDSHGQLTDSGREALAARKKQHELARKRSTTSPAPLLVDDGDGDQDNETAVSIVNKLLGFSKVPSPIETSTKVIEALRHASQEVVTLAREFGLAGLTSTAPSTCTVQLVLRDVCAERATPQTVEFKFQAAVEPMDPMQVFVNYKNCFDTCPGTSTQGCKTSALVFHDANGMRNRVTLFDQDQAHSVSNLTFSKNCPAVQEPLHTRNLVFVPIPGNFDETIPRAGLSTNPLSLIIADQAVRLPTSLEQKQALAASRGAHGEIWGQMEPDLRQISDVSGCALASTPPKHWPRKVSTAYFRYNYRGSKVPFGILRDPYDRVLHSFVTQASNKKITNQSQNGVDQNTKSRYSRYFADCDLNSWVIEELRLVKAGDTYRNNCTWVPQSEYFESKYGVQLPLDAQRLPASFDNTMWRHGHQINFQLDPIGLATKKCMQKRGFALSDTAMALIREVYLQDFYLRCKLFGYCDSNTPTCLHQFPNMCPGKD